jgi:hypothetical protein
MDLSIDSLFCNLLAYDRLAFGHTLLMKRVWLMNHGSITYGIVYGPESMEMEPYVILIFFLNLICMDVHHLGEY